MLIISENNPSGTAKLLNSLKQHTSGIESIAVLCNADALEMKTYKAAIAEYAHFFNIQLFDCTQLEQCLAHLKNTFALVAQDAVYLIQDIHLPDYLASLEKTGAYGFYFAYSSQALPFYNNHDEQLLIPSQHVYQDLYAWKFNCCSYALFNNYDMTLLRKTDLAQRILTLHSRNPHTDLATLKQEWITDISIDLHQVGLFAVNSPLGGNATVITTSITIPTCFSPPPGRGYRTPLDIERKRKRKERLNQQRELQAQGVLKRERRLKKNRCHDTITQKEQ